MELLQYETAARARGYTCICGIDEAGRGPLAGPVCAAAVILPQTFDLPGLNDSKKLTEKKREQLFPMIQEQAVSWSVAMASHEEIDSLNILRATFLAMRRAAEGLDVSPDYALIDGNACPGLSVPEQAVIKGDSLSASIAAASVLAKVTRDHAMLELDERYPQYQFARHKGYGTRLHYQLLEEYGASPVHRESFLKKFWEKHRG